MVLIKLRKLLMETLIKVMNESNNIVSVLSRKSFLIQDNSSYPLVNVFSIVQKYSSYVRFVTRRPTRTRLGGRKFRL